MLFVFAVDKGDVSVVIIAVVLLLLFVLLPLLPLLFPFPFPLPLLFPPITFEILEFEVDPGPNPVSAPHTDPINRSSYWLNGEIISGTPLGVRDIANADRLTALLPTPRASLVLGIINWFLFKLELFLTKSEQWLASAIHCAQCISPPPSLILSFGIVYGSASLHSFWYSTAVSQVLAAFSVAAFWLAVKFLTTLFIAFLLPPEAPLFVTFFVVTTGIFKLSSASSSEKNGSRSASEASPKRTDPSTVANNAQNSETLPVRQFESKFDPDPVPLLSSLSSSSLLSFIFILSLSSSSSFPLLLLELCVIFNFLLFLALPSFLCSARDFPILNPFDSSCAPFPFPFPFPFFFMSSLLPPCPRDDRAHTASSG